jgi:hypothetical protein
VQAKKLRFEQGPAYRDSPESADKCKGTTKSKEGRKRREVAYFAILSNKSGQVIVPTGREVECIAHRQRGDKLSISVGGFKAGELCRSLHPCEFTKNSSIVSTNLVQ